MVMQRVPSRSADHYERVKGYARAAVVAALLAWREVNPDRIGESWARLSAEVAPVVALSQLQASESALWADGGVRLETGQYELPDAFADPFALAGWTGSGADLEQALLAPGKVAREAIGRGFSPAQALDMGRARVELLVQSNVADAGRQAAAVGFSTRFTGGYTRMLNPPSCSRCAILAGKWFRWNAGFERHPRCDCTHIPVKSQEWARDEGFVADPYEYFNSLPEVDQARLFGKDNARAIRGGADIFQVENARRGSSGMTTTASTGRRGVYRGRGARLTPEGIYRTAGTPANAQRMLERYGYVLPGGQDPEGVLRGRREGWGQMGGGGKRIGARFDIEQARRTGVRRTDARATMTAAERRRFDAALRWDTVREGRNPFGNRPLTDRERLQVERDFAQQVLGFFNADPSLARSR